MKSILSPIAYLGERYSIALAQYRQIDGIRVGVTHPGADADPWGRIAAALTLIKDLDPLKLERLRRDFRQVLVLPDYPTCFWFITRSCILEQDTVMGRSPAIIASALVHEGVHARLNGICTSLDLDPRIEVPCTREEIAFARKLPCEKYPSTDVYVTFLEERLKAQLESLGG